MRHLFAAALLALAGAAPPPATCDLTLAGAHVFTGARFAVRDLSMRGGRFVAADPALARVDAARLWLIPPLADAHTHAVDPTAPATADAQRRWLAEGVFYALNPGSVRPAGPDPAPADDQVEIAAAGAGLTRPGGHPTQLYPAGLEGRAYHSVSTPAQARTAVSTVKANGARFVKLYLLNHTDSGGGDGLSKASFEAAVAEAKRLGLRPIVHVEDAADVRLAVAAEVFALVHLPYWPPTTTPTRRPPPCGSTPSPLRQRRRQGSSSCPPRS